MATEVPLTLYKGSRKAIVLTLQSADNITGWTIVATIRADYDQPVLAAIEATLTTPATGVFTVTFTSAVTAGLPIGVTNFIWDVWRTNQNNEEILVAPSALTVKRTAKFP